MGQKAFGLLGVEACGIKCFKCGTESFLSWTDILNVKLKCLRIELGGTRSLRCGTESFKYETEQLN